jgi:hypothetical protein
VQEDETADDDRMSIVSEVTNLEDELDAMTFEPISKKDYKGPRVGHK